MSKSIQAYSDEERVRRYDADMDLLHPNRHKMVAVALEVLPYSADEELVAFDLGIGTGFFTERFLRKYPRATVVGVDGSEAMITLARTRLHGVRDRVRLIGASFEDLRSESFGGEDLDVVFSSYALHHLDVATKRRVVTGAVDRLKTGGWIFNADLVSSRYREIEQIIQGIRVLGIESRNAGVDPRFRNATRIGAFLNELEDGEGDQPLTMAEDIHLLRQSGIANATVFWQEYDEVVYGGCKKTGDDQQN
jgi:2-polyprenyl-3-methyl-5-hydroxy-6-metoxy-1,4-benzoquinol methylase